MRSRASVVAILLACGFVCSHGVAQVKVWQGTLTLPTSEENAPDPNPQFDAYENDRFNYPYTLRANLSGIEKPHAWRALFLENEYLKCSVLPDLGGHIYTCTDKISGKPMFYANPTIKKARIGYRGAWAAFGVEFNFPVSHNWVTMSPVDFAARSHEDGSASIWISNVDRPYGMQWTVELTLRPASTVLEEHVTLYNRSEVRHRYYWWDNAGVEVWNDSRIAYPMQFVASHGFTDVYSWPVGPTDKDLSVLSNHTEGPVSFFAHGSREPYMGIWNPHTQAGVVHYAESSNLPAKKIWSWGVDPAGLGWRKALSDNDSAYVEVQAGLFRNQETYAFLDPGQSISFSGYWMPVRDTGGITRANRVGIVSMERKAASLEVALNVNRPIVGAHLLLTQSGKVLKDETEDLVPEKTWRDTLTGIAAEGAVRFELRDRDGNLQLAHTEGMFDWEPASEIKTGPQTPLLFPPPEQRSAEDWLQVGNNEELNGAILAAWETYRNGLARFHASQGLAVAAGRLAMALQRPREAESLLAAALARNTTDAEVAYYLGLAEETLGKNGKARDAFEIAFRQSSFRAAAAIRLGEMDARQGEWKKAAEYLGAARTAEPGNVLAQEELTAVLRARGDAAAAERIAREGLVVHPTSDFFKIELQQMDNVHLAADTERVLRAAAQYMRLGLYDRARALLSQDYPQVDADQSEPGTVSPRENPLVHYYLAYCNYRLKMESSAELQRAAKLSAVYVFPHSEADKQVLEAALAADSSDATAHALLGTLLFSKGAFDEGIAHWEQARKLSENMPVLDANLGNAYLYIRRDVQDALVAFRSGLKTDPANEAIYAGLEAAMSMSGSSAAEIAESLGNYPHANEPGSKLPANFAYQLALTRAEAGEFERAEEVMEGRYFPSEEGGITSDEVLFEVHLLKAEKQAASNSCLASMAFVQAQGHAPDEQTLPARTDVRLARIAQACASSELSKKWMEKAAARTSTADLPWAITANTALGRANDQEAGQKLQNAIEAVKLRLEHTRHTGEETLLLGQLEASAGRTKEAQESFRAVLLLPDAHMTHHFAREGLSGVRAKTMLNEAKQ